MSGNLSAKIKVRDKYDREAESYDELYLEEQLKKYALMAKLVSLDGNQAYLDCGCGTGLLIERALRGVKLAVGVDFSFGMLRRAKEKLKGRRSVELVLADGNHLPFIDGAFHTAFSFTVVDGKVNREGMLAEIHRTLRPGGLAVVSVVKGAMDLKEFKLMLKRSKFRALQVFNEAWVKDYLAVCRASKRALKPSFHSSFCGFTPRKLFDKSTLSNFGSFINNASISSTNSLANLLGNVTFSSIKSMGKGKPVASLKLGLA